MKTDYDAIIVGGGPAGLSAALYLGRSCRSALVIDLEQPRHAVSKAVHGFPTRDGVAPARYRELCWEELQKYTKVEKAHGEVTKVEKRTSKLSVMTSRGERYDARALLLAVGVKDQHPDIPGFQELWGKHVFHCPYCHAWELRERPLAVLCRPPLDWSLTKLLRGWSPQVICFANGESDECPLAEDDQVELKRSPIVSLSQVEDEECPLVITTEDGEIVRCAGLFVPERCRPVELVESLNLSMEETAYIRFDQEQRTSRDGVWAAGECTKGGQSVLAAAAQGGRAGQCMNSYLVD